MMEIERKILGIDKKVLLKKIAALKPTPDKLFDGLVRVKYFDYADKRIYKKRDLLRVREFVPRQRTSYVELVYKKYRGVKDACKQFEELEMAFPGNGHAKFLEEFLKQLGLKETVYYEKKRMLFAYKNVKFEIDEHPGIPVFMEIEGPSAKAIDAAIFALGLSENEQSCETIQELLTRKYKGKKLNGMVF